MSSTPLPPGYSPPSAVITENDHGGWVTITNGVMLCNVLLFLAIRLYIRFSISPPFRHDDTVLCLATALSVTQAVIVFLQVSRGFGKSVEQIRTDNLLEVQKLVYASDILYLVDLFLSKSCVCLLLIRLTPNRIHVVFFRTLLGFSTFWIVISVFMVALRCDLSQPWIQYNVRCRGLSARWICITILNVFIEVSLFLGSVLLIVNLQMARQKKTVVTMVFGCRLPLIAVTILRLHYLTLGFQSANPTLVALPAVLLAQVELGWSIISATIPCLNPFIRAISTKYGAMDSETIMDGNHLSETHEHCDGVHRYSLPSVTSTKYQNLISRDSAMPINSATRSDHHESLGRAADKCAAGKSLECVTLTPQLYPGYQTSNTARIYSEGRVEEGSISGDNIDTSKMIIKKEIQWVVETERDTFSVSNTGFLAEALPDHAQKECAGR